jgi:glycosyltransferase involved in cell wall biosynthesis
MPRRHTASSDPVRVALIHYRDDASVGGSLRVGQLLGNHLDRTRIEPHFIFAYGGPGPVTASAQIPVHFVNARGPGDLQGWLRIRRIIHQLQPELIHFLDPVLWINLAIFDWRGPRLNHIHGPLPERITVLSHRLSFAIFRASMKQQISVSKQVELKAIKVGAAKSASLCTIYNAIDCGLFEHLPSKEDARAHLDLPSSAYLLGMVCRLVPEKGCLDGIRLMAHLPDDYHLVICGTGPQEVELRSTVASTHLQSRIHFLGSHDSIQPIYAAIDNLLFLSKTEPFGLVIAEAMASGVPVVGIAAEGGYCDPDYPLVTHNNALLLELDNPLGRNESVSESLLQRLAKEIVDLRISPRRMSDMAGLASEWVNDRFAIQKSADKLADLYISLA